MQFGQVLPGQALESDTFPARVPEKDPQLRPRREAIHNKGTGFASCSLRGTSLRDRVQLDHHQLRTILDVSSLRVVLSCNRGIPAPGVFPHGRRSGVASDVKPQHARRGAIRFALRRHDDHRQINMTWVSTSYKKKLRSLTMGQQRFEDHQKSTRRAA